MPNDDTGSSEGSYIYKEIEDKVKKLLSDVDLNKEETEILCKIVKGKEEQIQVIDYNSVGTWSRRSTGPFLKSIAEKCFDIWGILKMATVNSVQPRNNLLRINHIIRCRSKLLPLGFSKFVLVLIL